MKTRLSALLVLTALVLTLSLQNTAASVLPIQPDSLWLRADQGVSTITPPIVDRMTNQVAGLSNIQFGGNINGGPKFVANGINGKPSISLTNSALVTGPTTAFPAINNIFDGGATVFIVFQPRGGTAGTSQRLLDTTQQGSNGWEIYYNVTGNTIGFSQRFSGGSASWTTPVSAPFIVGSNYVLALTYNADSTANLPSIWRSDFNNNGQSLSLTQFGSNSGTRNAESANFWVGSRNYTDPNEAFNGLFSEVIIYNSVLSAANRQAVNDVLYYTFMVPEPSTVLLMLCGGGLLFRVWRRR